MSVDPGSGAPMADRMQSLLSQAVEDQRSEQRQLTAVLMDVRGQLTRIAADLEAPRAAAAGEGGASDEAVATLSRDLREAVRMLAERLDAVGRSVQERGADLAEIKVAVADLHSAIRGHTNALAGVNQALAAVPAVGERVGGLQDNLVSLHDRLVGLEEVAASVDRLGLRIESADQDLRELRSAFTGMASRMAELPSRSDLGAAGAQSTESLDVIAGRLARVESAIPELLSRIDAIREHAATVTTAASDGTAVPVAPISGAGEVVARLDAVEAALVVLTEQLSAEPEPAGAEFDEEGVDPVADQLAELTEGLFGEDGLAARLEGAGIDEDALDQRVTEVVQSAVAASEQRLSAHMDEAVLALAEALFRVKGRPARSAAPSPAPVPTPAPAPPPPAPAPVAVPEPVAEVEEVEDDFGDDDGYGDGAYGDQAVDETDDFDESDESDADESDDAEAPEEAPATPAAAWQPPPVPAADVTPPPDEDRPGKRRPWWRPGD